MTSGPVTLTGHDVTSGLTLPVTPASSLSAYLSSSQSLSILPSINMSKYRFLLLVSMTCCAAQRFAPHLPERDHNAFAGFQDRPDIPETHFKLLGYTAVNTEFAHLTFEYDLHATFTQINDIIMGLHDTRQSAPHGDPTDEFDVLQDHFALQRDRVAALMQYAAPKPEPLRTRRAACAGICVGIAAGVAAAAGLGLSIYSTVETNAMSDRLTETVNALEEGFVRLDDVISSSLAIDNLVTAAANIARRNVIHRSKVFWFHMTLLRITTHVDAIENTLRSARHNRLDPSIISGTNMTNLYQHLHRFALHRGLALISTDAHDLLHLPATLTFSTTGFFVLTHYPMIRPDTRLDIYQYIRLPIPVSSGMFLAIDSEFDTIAISADHQTFRVTSGSELASDCHTLGSFYACPRGNSARHPPPTPPEDPIIDPALCLWGLLTGHSDMVNKVCEKTLVRPTTAAFQISARTFLTYGESMGNISCSTSHGLTTPFHTTAYGTFHLPAGCTADSDQFILASADSGYTRTEAAWTKATPISTNVSHFMDGLDSSDIDDLLTGLRQTKINLTKISLTEARRHLQLARQASHFDFSLSHLLPSLSFGTITFLLTLGHILYTSLTRRAQSQNPTTTPSVVNTFVPTAPYASAQPPAYPKIPL